MIERASFWVPPESITISAKAKAANDYTSSTPRGGKDRGGKDRVGKGGKNCKQGFHCCTVEYTKGLACGDKIHNATTCPKAFEP